MLKNKQIAGIELSRNDMKKIQGGMAPAASEWNCGGAEVCWGGLANPASACGYTSCTYIGSCSPTQVSCSGGGGGGGTV